MAGTDPSVLRRRLDARVAEQRLRLRTAKRERAILDAAPQLHDLVSFAPLADGLPTPIVPVDVDGTRLWVKRDDVTSSLYGGNKVRKFEFVLAPPAGRHAVVVSGGGTASHHVLALVMYSRLVGADVEAVLFDQPAPNPGIEHLAAVLAAYEVPTRRAPNLLAYPAALALGIGDAWRRRRRGALLYPGASTPAGTLGYVGAGLEIAAAARAGDCPTPDTVVCALGSGGTTVGLAVGLALGGLHTRVAGVRVADAAANNRVFLGVLEAGTRALLAAAERPMRSAMNRIEVVTDFFGPGYGIPTDAGTQALAAARKADLPAEQTYTAKALAAALEMARDPARGTVCFVDTVSAVDPFGVPTVCDMAG